MIVCSTFGMICSLIFIIIVAIHRQCHTLIIFLVLNSTIAGLMANITCFSQAIYQLLDSGNDHLCPIRGLLLHTTAGIFYHTLCVQALHRLFATVYSTRRYLQTVRSTMLMVGIQWIFSTTFGLPIYFTDRINYQSESGMCQVRFEERRLTDECLIASIGFHGRSICFSLYCIDYLFHTIDFHRLYLCSNRSIYDKQSIFYYESSIEHDRTSTTTMRTATHSTNSSINCHFIHSWFSLRFLLSSRSISSRITATRHASN